MEGIYGVDIATDSTLTFLNKVDPEARAHETGKESPEACLAHTQIIHAAAEILKIYYQGPISLEMLVNREPPAHNCHIIKSPKREPGRRRYVRHERIEEPADLAPDPPLFEGISIAPRRVHDPLHESNAQIWENNNTAQLELVRTSPCCLFGAAPSKSIVLESQNGKRSRRGPNLKCEYYADIGEGEDKPTPKIIEWSCHAFSGVIPTFVRAIAHGSICKWFEPSARSEYHLIVIARSFAEICSEHGIYGISRAGSRNTAIPGLTNIFNALTLSTTNLTERMASGACRRSSALVAEATATSVAEDNAWTKEILTQASEVLRTSVGTNAAAERFELPTNTKVKMTPQIACTVEIVVESLTCGMMIHIDLFPITLHAVRGSPSLRTSTTTPIYVYTSVVLTRLESIFATQRLHRVSYEGGEHESPEVEE
ncbi:unnamed protein product [Diplocarpon coronariae]